MKESVISFETARLAKEKGFNIPVLNYYFEDGVFIENKLTGTNGYYGEEYEVEYEELLKDWNDKMLTTKSGNRCFGCSKSKGYLETHSAPTQSLLQKWLREIHNIVVEVSVFAKGYIEEGKFCYKFWVFSNEDLELTIPDEYETWEEVLETGLIEGLKLIKE